LPHGYASDEEVGDFQQEFSHRLKHLIQSASIESLLNRQQQVFSQNRIQNHQNKFYDSIQLEHINGDSRVQKREDIDYRIQQEGDEIHIIWASKELTIPHYLNTALSSLLQEQTFTVSSLQGLLTPQGKIDFVKKFVQSGFLRIDHV
jgi:hypothetical protein